MGDKLSPYTNIVMVTGYPSRYLQKKSIRDVLYPGGGLGRKVLAKRWCSCYFKLARRNNNWRGNMGIMIPPARLGLLSFRNWTSSRPRRVVDE